MQDMLGPGSGVIPSTDATFGMSVPGLHLRNVHDPERCEGRGCPVHHPSGHHMATWPMLWRADTGVMERTCPHGIGHPDPDHIAFVTSLTPEHDCLDKNNTWRDEDECKYPHLNWQAVHGCDGCCVPAPTETPATG